MNSQIIVRTCCKLTLDCLLPNSFAVLNVVPVPVVSIVTFSCCNFQSSEDMHDSISTHDFLFL